MEIRPDLLSVAEASVMLGITESAVRERIKRGDLPAVKSGGTWTLAAADVLESQGLDRAVARYLCQFLAMNISENIANVVNRRVSQTIDRAISERVSERVSSLTGDIERLSYQRGQAECKLETALNEVGRLGGDVEALVAQLGREPRRN